MQVGEVCASGITFINSNYNGALVHGSGRIIMVLGVILMSGFVFLCNLRQLEIAGDFGFIVVLIMVIVIVVDCPGLHRTLGCRVNILSIQVAQESLEIEDSRH